MQWQLGRFRGVAQIDVALDEDLGGPENVRPTVLPGVLPATDVVVDAVSAELALAWKLRWWLSEELPQCKDIWDALLLLRHAPLDDTALAAHLARLTTLAGEVVRVGVDRMLAGNGEHLEPLHSHWIVFRDDIVASGATDVPVDAAAADEALLAALRQHLHS